jgi:hypothetical protein
MNSVSYPQYHARLYFFCSIYFCFLGSSLKWFLPRVDSYRNILFRRVGIGAGWLTGRSLRGTNSRTSKKTSAPTTKSLSSPDEVVLIQERIAFKSLCANPQTHPSRNGRAPSDRILQAEIRHRTDRPSRGPRTTVGILPRTRARPSGRPRAEVKPIPRGQSR